MSQYRLGFLAFRDLLEAYSLANIDTESGAQFLAISMKVFMKSWKFIRVNRLRPSASGLETSISGSKVGKLEFEPALLSITIS